MRVEMRIRAAIALVLTCMSAVAAQEPAVFRASTGCGRGVVRGIQRTGGGYGSVLGTFDLLRPGGGTALLEAVRQIAFVFQTARHQRKVILLISDGNDTQMPAAGLPSLPYEIGSKTENTMGESRRSLLRDRAVQGSRNAVRRSDAVLYAIGIGTRTGMPVDTNLLDGLTKESGGCTEPLRSPSEIAAAVARICDDLQSQYLLTFEPAHADGTYHPMRVRTKDRRLRVRTRAGYIAAPGP